jgi:hypothetical protein
VTTDVAQGHVLSDYSHRHQRRPATAPRDLHLRRPANSVNLAAVNSSGVGRRPHGKGSQKVLQRTRDLR